MDYSQKLKKLVEKAVEEGASDLHISVNHHPTLRITGKLIPLIKEEKIKPEDAQNFAFSLLSPQQKEEFLKKRDIDFSYEIEKTRLRINIFFQKGTISIAIRIIPSKIRTVEELNLPPVLHQFTVKTQGLVLITGASSQGKSTTLAALIDEINHTRPCHIVTIEDPIEYVFEDDKAIIDQREIFRDALSFPRALRATFRQDPDVIMVGEMRDLETISIVLSAAETGHLVFATLHTNSAPETIHRIVDVFPGVQQNQIRSQLSSSLLGAVSQRLIPALKGGFVPACEVMINTPAIANLIRENKIHEIPAIIETSSKLGMISFNRSLADLVRRGDISLQDALFYSPDPSSLKGLLR
jgi:twitching motility protein PilT